MPLFLVLSDEWGVHCDRQESEFYPCRRQRLPQDPNHYAVYWYVPNIIVGGFVIVNHYPITFRRVCVLRYWP